MSRLEQLKQFVDEDPMDPFNTYALALEYQKTDAIQAMRIFESLLLKHPDYVPSYYHFGKLLQQNGQYEKALSVFDQGIAASRTKNDTKAERELVAAKQELIDE